MRYLEKHPRWKESDLKEIEWYRTSINKFYGYLLRYPKTKQLDEEIVTNLEGELDELIADFKYNHECTKTPKISFTESLERLGESWGKA